MKVSVVTTLYKSAPYIQEFFQRARQTILNVTEEIEFIFVDDGSPDHSSSIVRELIASEQNSQIKLAQLSRNFGHQIAIMTGLKLATGDLIFLLDVDLEEPPEIFLEMHERMMLAQRENKEPIDVVYAYQTSRKGGIFERFTGGFFYKFFNLLADVPIPMNAATVRLMTKAYVDTVVTFEERELFLNGVFVLAGFNQVGIPFTKYSKGTSTYSVMKKLSMATRGITSFSTKPLVFIFIFGATVSMFSIIGILSVVARILFLQTRFDAGWPSLILAICFFGGMILAAIGVIGIYIAHVFSEVKQRPRVIKNIYSSLTRK